MGSFFAEVDDGCFDFVSNNAWNFLIFVPMSVDGGRTMCIVKLNVDWERVDVFDDQQVGGGKTHGKNSKRGMGQGFDSSRSSCHHMSCGGKGARFGFFILDFLFSSSGVTTRDNDGTNAEKILIGISRDLLKMYLALVVRISFETRQSDATSVVPSSSQKSW